MNFANTTIQNMLKNIMYLGILRSGESQSEIFPNLQIVDVETFERAEQIRKGRTQKHSDVPLNCKGRALLAGKLYCGHCGSKLVLSTSGSSYVKADGSCSKTVRLRYQCHYKVRHPQLCDGQSAYGVVTLDKTIEETISRLFEEIKTVPQEEMMQNEIMERKKECETHLTRAKKISQDCEREYADYKAEILKIIRGESSLSSDMLNELLEDCQRRKEKAEEEVIRWQKAAADKKQQTEEMEKLFQQVMTWSEMFKNCNLDEKKMILSQLIHKIHIWKHNKIEIEFNIHIQQILAYKPKEALNQVSA